MADCSNGVDEVVLDAETRSLTPDIPATRARLTSPL